ncbi:tryptophan-rich sensory protein [Acidithiobacillus sp. HP-6]|uniref:TspO/MBR family protein n=1 Tax=unclassified Acidithiobacillus TaxID=2614800 RepID=UPI00187A7EF8|nr:MULTISPECIES: TspO/MBR family protein [unclassified Acidithiobacillus]MBE7563804.1 tryptophan-rich sensory protein [Acidithiobacillus sp. HP-6]MBE7570451.1 tryptophan-rich sensory protein [Acidithiobacillus sp. HP-2]
MDMNHFALVSLISLAITLAVATTGSLFRPDAWYTRLQKPKGTPPPWVFPVVWTLLYIIMAFAAALIYVSPASLLRTVGLSLYGLQLLCNAAWSWLFFGRHQVLWALADLVLLLLLVLACFLVFMWITPLAAWLLVPYLLWLCVALYLNAATYRLNRFP